MHLETLRLLVLLTISVDLCHKDLQKNNVEPKKDNPEKENGFQCSMYSLANLDIICRSSSSKMPFLEWEHELKISIAIGTKKGIASRLENEYEIYVIQVSYKYNLKTTKVSRISISLDSNSVKSRFKSFEDFDLWISSLLPRYFHKRMCSWNLW